MMAMATSTPAPMPPALGPIASQVLQPLTVPITVQMPTPAELQWWEVQGVLPSIAAVIAVIGTAASLHWNTSRNLKAARKTTEEQLAQARETTEKQLEHARAEAQRERDHASEQSQRDRIIAARKAVYGDLINSYSEVAAILGGLPHLEPEKVSEMSKPLTSMNASVTKSWIWGEVETVFEIRELYSQLSELFLEAIARCHPIFANTTLIRRLRADAEKAEAKHEVLLQQIREAENGRLHGHAYGIKELQKEADMLFERASNLRQQVFQLQRDVIAPIDAYDAFLMGEQAVLMLQINKVMAAARKELGLQGDLARLEEQSADMSLRAAASIAKLKAVRG